MKKIVAILLSLCMILALCACGGAKKEEPAAAPAAENETGALNGDIVVLYTNDTHCGVGEGVTFEGLSAVKKALEAVGKTVLLVDNGDAVQGDTIGTLSKGEYIIDIMN